MTVRNGWLPPVQEMIVVSDTSPLSALLTVGEADLLLKIFHEVVVPDAVRNELLRGHSTLPAWLRVQTVKDRAKVDQFARTRQGTIKWIKGLTQADLDKANSGPMAQWVPTIGHLAMMLPGHVLMHLGQFQVIRRKLGKPILF